MQTLPVKAITLGFPPSTASLVQANLLVGSFYLLFVALISQAFSGVAPVWPSAAVAMFAAIMGGWRWLPGIAIASWIGNALFMAMPSVWSLWISLGNVLGPWIAILILRRAIPDVSSALESGRGVIWFGVCVAVSAAISAGFGATAAVVNATSKLSFNDAFFTWFVCDLNSVLMLTPAFVHWWKDSRAPFKWPHGALDLWLASTTLIIMTALLFFMPANSTAPMMRAGTFLILLPLLWVALRFPQRSTFTLLSIFFVLSLIGTGMGQGAMTQIHEPYTRLQILFITVGMVTLLVSAMSFERRRVLETLNISYAELEERVVERTQQLRDNLINLEMLLDNVPVPMVITRPDQSLVIYANLAAADYFGLSIAHMVDSSSVSYFHRPEDFKALEKILEKEGSLSSHEVALRHRDGHTLWALLSAVPSRYNDIPVMMLAFQDISPVKQREIQLEHLVSTDALTGLATRRHFMQRGTEMLLTAARNKQTLALFILDLDHFKIINDTYGHPAGDVVLRRVAETCRSSLRPGDLCGRLGGEEFGVILINVNQEAAHRGAERLRRLIGQLFIQLDGDHHVNPSASIGGVLLLPSDMAATSSPNLEEAIIAADKTLYRAKNTGRNRVVFAPPIVFKHTSPPPATTTEEKI